MTCKIKLEPEAVTDIQQAIDWYNKQQRGLGKKYFTEVKSALRLLKSNPAFAIRYDEIHCLPLKKFPFMIHYSFHEKQNLVIVRAILHTSRSPEIWKERK